MSNYRRGRLAEFAAKTYMVLHGYRIIGSNYSQTRGSGAGEIDFIAKRGNTVVFCEVKLRPSFDEAAYAISNTQKRRIIRGAECFIRDNPRCAKCDLRFDALLVVPPFRVRHIKNAWQADV